MPVGAIITRGFGSFSTTSQIVTRGFGPGAAPPPPPVHDDVGVPWWWAQLVARRIAERRNAVPAPITGDIWLEMSPITAYAQGSHIVPFGHPDWIDRNDYESLTAIMTFLLTR